ncbi:unnamed protein product [Gordionus sp. m RMFG-2023]|uniref:uncharacterized protein LOC135931525 n=1 Tax=Gordionus sp. m RMFG-2023 TaxID=3053472 RepID=UPI0030DE96E6
MLKTKEALENIVAQNPLETRLNITNYGKRCLEDPEIENYSEAIPSFISLKSHIDRLLMKYRPPRPHSILDIELSAEYAMTTRNERFLIHGTGNLYVFGTDSMLRLTEGSNMIYMDGTFHIAPTLFYQLYTLHVMYGVMIPIIYALLPDKTKETYIRLFQIITNFCAERQITFNPRFGQTDFEAASISALKFVFPVIIKGCFFHYSQALWRRCQSLGLVSLYLNHSNVHKVVRRMTTLPFCKEEDISRVRHNCYIMASENPMLMDFMEYMDTTWLGLNAIFPHGIWTRYKVDGPRTNNHLEGFHHALKRKTAHAHPNVYILIKTLIGHHSNDLKIIQINN